jgi:phage tail-like protein
MSVIRDYPYANHCFTVDLGDGEPATGVIEVILPDLCISLNSDRGGGDPQINVPQNPSKPFYTNCTIKRAYQGRLDFYQWWNETANGTHSHRTVTINLLPENQQGPVTTWRLGKAIPARYSFSPLSSRDGGVLVESLEIAFESIRME